MDVGRGSTWLKRLVEEIWVSGVVVDFQANLETSRKKCLYEELRWVTTNATMETLGGAQKKIETLEKNDSGG